MTILLFGKSGQVGTELLPRLKTLGDVIALDEKGEGALCGDFTDPQGIARTIQQVNPKIIVNAAAYTAVDKAESDQDLANLINATTPGLIAEQAKSIDAWLIHYSTDYVHDGSGTAPWVETDLASPLNYYGHSKRAGEQAIQQSGCNHLIFRTSWVYSEHGKNFVKTMLRLAKDKTELSVVNDQVGAPTSAALIADVTARAIEQIQNDQSLAAGIYNLTPKGEASWFDFATLVIETAKQTGFPVTVNSIAPVTTENYPTPAQRPLNSRLNCSKLESALNMTLPEWHKDVVTVTENLVRQHEEVSA
ncbi:MAG: dTDP-4-dehydrorhamnose reductase [bacterium]